MDLVKSCLACNAELKGRADKKFCDPHCKSAYHYEKDRKKASLFLQIDRQLKQNRRLLKIYNKAGKATIRSQTLIDQGFDPNYFTHYWKNSQGDIYLFVYEFGFLTKTENGKKKYILVTWQAYMKK